MIEPIDAVNPTPGQLLRRQRQHIGWTVEEIANALCLGPELIRELEADNFEGMGGSTFILGYLRGYARLVGIDLEEAIENHREAIPEYTPDPEHLPPEARERARRSKRRRTWRINPWLVAAGLALVVTGVAAWLWLPDSGEPGSATAPAPLAETPAPMAQSDSGGSAPVSQPAARLERERAISVAVLQEALDHDQPLPLNLVHADIDAVAAARPKAAEVMAADPAEDGNHLVLIFDESSWADVRDAKGSRLLSQTVDAGSSVDLVGAPPFTVFLGNASGVRVQYLGKIQALSQAKKGLFARFIVGGGGQ